MSHNHDHDHHHGIFAYRTGERKRLVWSLSITSVVMILEFAGGLFTRSIALISDAGHMFTHSFAILIGLIAIHITGKPQCHHRTYGLYRAEVLAAFINGLFLVLAAAVIVYEAVERFLHPVPVLGQEMLFIALIGLATNLASIAILRGGKKDINIRGVFFHMMADAASSVGILAAALVIMRTGWNWLDPLVSVGISVLILIWAWKVIKESAVILLEMAPKDLDTDILSKRIQDSFPQIVGVESAHLWSITSDMRVFTARLVLGETPTVESWDRLVAEVDAFLHRQYRIIETTLQPRVWRENDRSNPGGGSRREDASCRSSS